MKKYKILSIMIATALVIVVLTPNSHRDYSERDLGCLAKNIYFEGRNLDEKEQAAIAFVVLNRTKSERYPDQICDVIYQNSHKKTAQFSWTNNRRLEVREPESLARSFLVAQQVLNGDVKDPTRGATHYYSHRIIKNGGPIWARKGKEKIKMDHHTFMKLE